MKKTLTVTTLALLAGGVSVYAQGQVSTADIYGPGIQIFAAQATGNNTTVTDGQYTGSELLGNSGLAATYNTASGPTVNFTGAPLGTGYTVELLIGPAADVGTTSYSALSETGTLISTWGGNGFWSPGVANAIADAPSGYAAGSSASVAIAAWSGAYTSLAAAQAAHAQWGLSNIGSLTAGLGGGTFQPPSATGLDSFSLVYTAATPEPSTIALGVIGASSLLLRRRK